MGLTRKYPSIRLRQQHANRTCSLDFMMLDAITTSLAPSPRARDARGMMIISDDLDDGHKRMAVTVIPTRAWPSSQNSHNIPQYEAAHIMSRMFKIRYSFS